MRVSLGWIGETHLKNLQFREFTTHLWLLECRKNAPKVGIHSPFHLHHHHSQGSHRKFSMGPNTFGKKKGNIK